MAHVACQAPSIAFSKHFQSVMDADTLFEGSAMSVLHWDSAQLHIRKLEEKGTPRLKASVSVRIASIRTILVTQVPQDIRWGHKIHHHVGEGGNLVSEAMRERMEGARASEQAERLVHEPLAQRRLLAPCWRTLEQEPARHHRGYFYHLCFSQSRLRCITEVRRKQGTDKGCRSWSLAGQISYIDAILILYCEGACTGAPPL